MNTIAKNTFIAMVSLALFYFIFLESNSFYLSSMSSFSLESKFATTIVPIMGLNALGFLCYPLYSLKLSRKKRRGTALVFAILWIVCLIIAATVSSPIAIVGAGYLSFFIMGVLGGNAYFGVAMMLAQSNRLITSVALAHAAGILLHLICFHIPLGRAGDAALLGLGIVAFSLVALFGWPSLQVPREGAAVDRMGNPIYPRKILDLQGAVAPPNLQEPRRFAIQLVALTILLAVLFNVLNSVTSLGTPWINQYAEVWPRLIVAVCGVVAGVFFDIDRRRHMGTVVLCVAFLAMAAALAAGSGLNITVCRVVFCAGSGIFAVFYLSLFIWLAAYMRVPQLWAGMGKVISNVVAPVVTIPSAVLAQANDQALTSLAFVMFAAVLILMTRAGMLAPDYEERISSYSKKSADTEETPDHETAEKPDHPPEQASPRSPEEALAAFCESYGLTKRESDVLAAVVSDERPLKHVAAELGVGLRTVQHHLTSLYKKTGTQTRTGLTARFIEESQNGAQARESHEEQPSEATRSASAEGASNKWCERRRRKRRHRESNPSSKKA